MKSEASFVSEISDSVLQSEEQVNVSVFKDTNILSYKV